MVGWSPPAEPIRLSAVPMHLERWFDSSWTSASELIHLALVSAKQILQESVERYVAAIGGAYDRT